MNFTSKFAVGMCLALVGMALPTQHSSSLQSRAQQHDTSPKVLIQPTMYQVLPLQTSLSGPAVSQLEVQRTEGVSTLENIAIFEGIPENAQICILGWNQGSRGEREFKVQGNGLLAAQQLSQLPSGEVSWENIAPIADDAVRQGLPLLHPDTTDWSEIDAAAKHVAGYVKCKETIYLKLQVDNRDGDGYVYLGQDSNNGLTLEFQ
ncbi:hypothetical protein F4808DRAFT_440554 [Astrocystis sublimbata]|nr:hypothetical protein F4808DRAFT_440554 [Astrocystis sublimbata]